MKTTARLTFEKVRFDEANDVHLVVSLQAPHEERGGVRPPVCVIPVVDVSGSMAGEKLHFAKQSVLKLVDHLAPGDFCGVVAFSTQVETLAPPAAMTAAAKEELRGLVGRLAPRHNTNLGGGMLAGLDHARVARLPPGMRVRVVLFTDGLANEGPAKTRADLLRLLEANLGEATLSAFGYGGDADPELLRDLATLGKGNYAHVAGPEDALTAFARELGGLFSTWAQRIEITVAPRDGLVLTDVVSDVDATEERGAVRIRIPELLVEEERNVVLAGRLAPRAAPGAEAVAEVTVAYETF
jgi:Ca-activated chloride channel family protein